MVVSISGIANPKMLSGTKEAANKSFNFDYSYWSHNVSIIISSIFLLNRIVVKVGTELFIEPTKNVSNDRRGCN